MLAHLLYYYYSISANVTQLLWKETSRMGVGVMKGSDDRFYVVAFFDPKGNVQSKFKENLPNITDSHIEVGADAIVISEACQENIFLWIFIIVYKMYIFICAYR